MKEIVNRLHENRQIELAKSILEANGYSVTQRLEESAESASYIGKKAVFHMYGPEGNLDLDWSVSADEMKLLKALDGMSVTIEGLSVDNGDFKDSYWDVSVGVGFTVSSISGRCLELAKK